MYDCPICYETRPVTNEAFLPCMHSLCNSCLSNISDCEEAKCPFCRLSFIPSVVQRGTLAGIGPQNHKIRKIPGNYTYIDNENRKIKIKVRRRRKNKIIIDNIDNNCIEGRYNIQTEFYRQEGNSRKRSTNPGKENKRKARWFCLHK